jgi:hypothetical protein
MIPAGRVEQCPKRPIPSDRGVAPLIGQKLLSFMGLEQLYRDEDRLGDLV